MAPDSLAGRRPDADIPVDPCRLRSARGAGAGRLDRGVHIMSDVDLPGRLGDPARSLATDPRADPRLVAALAPFGMDGLGDPPPVTPASPREEFLAFCAAAEAGFEAVFAALYEGLAPIDGVESETLTVPGGDDNEIKLYVHRPGRARRPAGLRVPHPRRRHGPAGGRRAGVCPRPRRARRRRPRRRRGRVPQRGRHPRALPVPGRARRLRRRPALDPRAPRAARCLRTSSCRASRAAAT